MYTVMKNRMEYNISKWEPWLSVGFKKHMIFYFVKLLSPKFPTVHVLFYKSEKRALCKSVTQTTNVEAVTIHVAM